MGDYGSGLGMVWHGVCFFIGVDFLITTKRGKMKRKHSPDNEGIKVGNIIRLEDGRVDKITAIIPSTSWDYQTYLTQEISPAEGQKPRIGKLAYHKRSDGTRAFELVE